MPETQEKEVEEWVKDFARKYRILSNKQFSPDNLVKLVDAKLQRRFVAARSYVEKELPHSGDWIDLILSNKRLPKQASEQSKTALVEKVLDYALATDALIAVKTNQGKDCLIAIDVTANPTKEQQKLNTIQGKREGNRSRGGYIMCIKFKALLSKSFGVYAHKTIIPKMSIRQLADPYSTFNYSQLSGGNQI